MLEAINTYSGVTVPNISSRVDTSSVESGLTLEGGIEVTGGLKLKIGDIVLMEDKPTEDLEGSHLAIKVGQFLTSHFKPSGSDMVHAMIWTQEHQDGVEPEIAEASGKGYVREGHLRWGTYHVWRCNDSNWASWAAQVAMIWASGKSIPYGYEKSLKAVTGRKGFGGDGKARAKRFIEDAFNPETTLFTECGGAFCSQFVLTAYQASAAQILMEKASEMGLEIDSEDIVERQFLQSIFLRTDAYHCSVRVLHARMKEDSKFFKKIGTLHIPKTQKTYDEQVWRSELNIQRARGIQGIKDVVGDGKIVPDKKIEPFLKPEEMEIDSKEWVQWVLDGTTINPEKDKE